MLRHSRRLISFYQAATGGKDTMAASNTGFMILQGGGYCCGQSIASHATGNNGNGTQENPALAVQGQDLPGFQKRCRNGIRGMSMNDGLMGCALVGRSVDADLAAGYGILPAGAT